MGFICREGWDRPRSGRRLRWRDTRAETGVGRPHNGRAGLFVPRASCVCRASACSARQAHAVALHRGEEAGDDLVLVHLLRRKVLGNGIQQRLATGRTLLGLRAGAG